MLFYFIASVVALVALIAVNILFLKGPLGRISVVPK